MRREAEKSEENSVCIEADFCKEIVPNTRWNRDPVLKGDLEKRIRTKNRSETKKRQFGQVNVARKALDEAIRFTCNTSRRKKKKEEKKSRKCCQLFHANKLKIMMLIIVKKLGES